MFGHPSKRNVIMIVVIYYIHASVVLDLVRIIN